MSKKRYMTLVTNRGKQKILKAAAVGKKVAISKIKVGDGNGSSYTIDESMTSLKNVVYETNIANFKQDPLNQNTLVVESLIPSDVGGFYIREIGLYDEDDELIVITSYEETYKPVAEEGSTMELFIRIAMVLSNTNAVTIVIDPSVVFVTQADLEKIYKLIGDPGTASAEFTDTSSIVIMLRELYTMIGDFKNLELDGYDTRPISEGGNGTKNITNILKFLWNKISNIELTDLKVKVTTWENHTLDKVLSKIKGWIGTLTNLKTKDKSSLVGAINELVDKDTEIVSTMGEYKASVDEYSKQLGVYVERHKVANDRLEKLLRG
ncbi:phage tail protein [Peptostreptococcus anaerobius]